jgi:SAM-dependent methyltransferase
MMPEMWHQLRKLEAILFLPAFVAYATLFRVPYSLRCRSCGRWLFDYAAARVQSCEKCAESALLHPARAYEERAQDIVVTGVSSSGNYIYRPVAGRVGQGKVLDIGCGQGHLLSRLEDDQRQLYGLEMASGLVKIAQKYSKGANLLVADAQSIPFQSNTFDYVTCTEVLEHIPGDQHVRECYRVLRPGGTALFTVPNKNGAGGGQTAAHVHYFTLDSFTAFLEQVGFEVVSRHGLGLYVPLLSHLLEVTALALRRNLPLSGPLPLEVPEFLATNFLVVCRKPLRHSQDQFELQNGKGRAYTCRIPSLIRREVKRLGRVGPWRFLLWQLWLLLTSYPRWRRDLTLFFTLRGKKRVVIKEIRGNHMYLDVRDTGASRDLAFEGVRERLSTEAVQRELKPGCVVIDIGANIGYYTLMEALVCPQS